MSSEETLQCTLCKSEQPFSKSLWLQHLISDSHQILARKQSVVRWGVREVREECLVVTTTFPVISTPAGDGGADKVVKYFSATEGACVVKDFLFWEERPQLAIVQFESRDKVLRAGSNCTEYLIDGERVYIKRAEDYSDLEWNLMLMKPEFGAKAEKGEIKKEPSDTDEKVLEQKIIKQEPVDDFPPIKKVKVENDDDEDWARIPPWESPPRPPPPKSKRQRKRDTDKQLQDAATPPQNAVSQLTDYVIFDRQWETPVFKDNYLEGKWSCEVIVNGITYPLPKDQWQRKKKWSQQFAAAHCLKALKTLPPSPEARTPPSPDVRSTPPDTPSFQPPVSSYLSEPVVQPVVLQPVVPPLPPPLPPTTSPQWLLSQFQRIRSLVSTPKEVCTQVEIIRNALYALFRAHDPYVLIIIYRNGHLRLRNPDCPANPELRVHVCRHHPQTGLSFFSDRFMNQVLSSLEGQQHYSLVQVPNKDFNLEGKLQFRKSGFPVTVTNSSASFVEAQVCRLLEYMICFDTRCYPLIILVSYWAQLNKVTLQCSQDSKSFEELPETLSWEWLVIFFFSHKKLIPTVREILERPHDVVKEERYGIDVGFCENMEYARQWVENQNMVNPATPTKENYGSEIFIMSTLGLFWSFLDFWGNQLGRQGFILNTKDGELISRDAFLSSNPGEAWNTKMTKKELASLRQIQDPKPNFVATRDISGGTFSDHEYKVNFSQWDLYMTHPLLFVSRFSLPQKMSPILDAMKYSAMKLQDFLQQFITLSSQQGRTDLWGSVENALKINEGKITTKLPQRNQ